MSAYAKQARPRRVVAVLVVALILGLSVIAHAQSAPTIQIGLGDLDGPEGLVPILKLFGLLTLLAIAPAILISITSFTRILVVLTFLRQAMGTHNAPPGQLMVILSLVLTGVVMAPVARRVHAEAIEPYRAEQLSEEEAFEAAKAPVREFLLRQTREADLELFFTMTDTAAPDTPDDVAMHLLIPAFLLSELQTAFEMGFLLFLPFVLIELVVASILTSMGMVMVPPTLISMPLKLLLFVAIDGWSLITQSLVTSFT